MYVNYGDKNFFENGILVEEWPSDSAFNILCCNPYLDEEDLFRFGDIQVDINDSWIEQEAVEQFCGCRKEEDPIGFALGCISYYSWDNFGAINYAYDWQRMDRKSIEEILKHRMIANDNLDITW